VIRLQKAAWVVLALGAALLVAGCDDPNESAVPDEVDFRNADVTYDGSQIVTDIEFYAPFTAGEFFYYFDTAGLGCANFLVKCRAGDFVVLGTAPDTPCSGLHNVSKYTGTPQLSGTSYRLAFPQSALDVPPASEFHLRYWFFEMGSGDRMPDTGDEDLVYVR